jgi:hypothetical protein
MSTAEVAVESGTTTRTRQANQTDLVGKRRNLLDLTRTKAVAAKRKTEMPVTQEEVMIIILVITFYAYAVTNCCFTHLRILLVLKAPQYCGPI